MKRGVVILLSLAMCAGLCACGNPPQTVPTEEPGATLDAGQSTPTPSPAPSAPEQGISEQRAREIALADAGVSEDSVTAIRVKRDVEKGVYVYDVEFYAGGKEYDYEIAAADGSILKKDFEVEDHWYHGGFAPQTGISQEQAEEIALQRVPGAQAEQIRLNLEMDDGRMVYEGKIIHQEREYDFEIDADTGEIISWEEESVFD